MSAPIRPGAEPRSFFVPPYAKPLVPSTTNPCEAPDGTRWVHAFSSSRAVYDQALIGKWLIRLRCQYVGYCWSRVRDATEAGTLGLSAKVSTDWGKAHDLAGMIEDGKAGWKDHAICVYTADWRDREDVARVGAHLHEVDAVRSSVLRYKPDEFTYRGTWQRSAPGEVAIYSMKPPYLELDEDAAALAALTAPRN